MEMEINNVRKSGEAATGDASHMLKMEFDQLKRAVNTLDKSLNDKFIVMQKETDDVVAKLFTTIATHPVHSRVDTLETRAAQFVTKDRFNALQEAMLDVPSSSTVDHIIEEMNRLPDRLLTRKDYAVYKDEMMREIEEKLELRVNFERLNQELDSYD